MTSTAPWGYLLSPLISSHPSSITNVYAIPQDQFPTTKASIALTTTSGILSFICSSMILNIIRMSNQKLTTTYHRLLALMSVFDIMASVCMALTTLPMPSDDILRFAGPMLGNKTTCRIQGFFTLAGLNGGASLYLCLSWYFVFKITFQFHTDTIRRRIEPFFYLLTSLVGIFLPTYSLLTNFIHTTPESSFCIAAPDHSDCDYSIDELYFVCNFDAYKYLKNGGIDITIIAIGTNIVLIIVAMILIIWTVVNQRNVIKQMLEVQGRRINHRMQADLDEYENKRAVVIQALMIMVATFAQGGVCTLLLLVFQFDQRSIDVILVFKSILYPMQGFWNLIIIVYDKAYLVHRNDRSIAIWRIIKDILFYPPQAHEIVLPPGFSRNATVTDGGNMEQQAHDDENVEEKEKEEIEVKNIILGREMGARPRERFDDKSIGFSVQGFQNVGSERNDDDLDEFLPIADTDFIVEEDNSAAGDADLRTYNTSAYTYHRRRRNKRFGMNSDELHCVEGEFEVKDRRRQGRGRGRGVDFNTTSTVAAKSPDGFIDDLSTHGGT